MGIIYKTIYPFQVLDKIREGKAVYGLNKDTRRVSCLNDIPTAHTVEVIDADNTNNQYEFWIEEREEIKDVEAV